MTPSKTCLEIINREMNNSITFKMHTISWIFLYHSHFNIFFSFETSWGDRTDFEYKLYPTLSMFQIVTPTGGKGRLIQWTLVLLLLIGEGSGCKSASLAPSGPFRHSEGHMVNACCMSY